MRHPYQSYPQVYAALKTLEDITDDLPMSVDDRIQLNIHLNAAIETAFDCGQVHARAAMTKTQLDIQSDLLSLAKRPAVTKGE